MINIDMYSSKKQKLSEFLNKFQKPENCFFKTKVLFFPSKMHTQFIFGSPSLQVQFLLLMLILTFTKLL